MANKYGASEVAGPGKGKNRPNAKAKVAARQTARKASGVSAQKNYVQTRMAEAAKSGKTLDKAVLRKKFQSGDVARKGFGAPKKKTGGTGSSSKAFPNLKEDVAALKVTGTGSSSTGSRKAYDGKPAPKSKYSLRGKNNERGWSPDTALSRYNVVNNKKSTSNNNSRKAYGGAKAPKPTWTLTDRNSDGKNSYRRNYSVDTYESRQNIGNDKKARKAKGRYGS